MNIKIVRLEMLKDKSVEYGKKQIDGPEDLAEIGFKLLNKSDREVFVVVCLDAKNHINSVQVVSIGTLGSALVHPREVYKVAILSNSASIAILHNHPSGSCEPSTEDIRITERLIDAGKILDIRIVYHVIVSDGDFYSFADKEVCAF